MAKSKPSRRDPIPALEWAAATFGLLIVIALLAIIGRAALERSGDEVPVLVAGVERIVATPAGHVVELVVANRSAVTAASVQVEGGVGQGTGAETSTVTIDYVPGNSQATGGLMFTRDPRADGLRLRVTGYEVP